MLVEMLVNCLFAAIVGFILSLVIVEGLHLDIWVAMLCSLMFGIFIGIARPFRND